MSAETTDRNWLGVAYSMCSPAAKAKAAACPHCGGTQGLHDLECDYDEPELEPSRCPRCLHYLTDEARCENCGQHAHE